MQLFNIRFLRMMLHIIMHDHKKKKRKKKRSNVRNNEFKYSFKIITLQNCKFFVKREINDY